LILCSTNRAHVTITYEITATYSHNLLSVSASFVKRRNNITVPDGNVSRILNEFRYLMKFLFLRVQDGNLHARKCITDVHRKYQMVSPLPFQPVPIKRSVQLLFLSCGVQVLYVSFITVVSIVIATLTHVYRAFENLTNRRAGNASWGGGVIYSKGNPIFGM
jgi:hypothetical protein